MNDDKSELLEQLIRLESLLRYRHMQTHRERGPMGDPHRGQGRILALLRLKPELSQKELSAILDMRSQSLGELLAKLERQGFISRTPSEGDRRSVDIHLTDAGKAAGGKGEESPDADSLFACLSGDEQSALSGYLGRLIASWEGQLEADPRLQGLRPRLGFEGIHGRRGGFPGFESGRGGGPERPGFGGRGFDGRGPGGRGSPGRAQEGQGPGAPIPEEE